MNFRIRFFPKGFLFTKTSFSKKKNEYKTSGNSHDFYYRKTVQFRGYFRAPGRNTFRSLFTDFFGFPSIFFGFSLPDSQSKVKAASLCRQELSRVTKVVPFPLIQLIFRIAVLDLHSKRRTNFPQGKDTCELILFLSLFWNLLHIIPLCIFFIDHKPLE